MEAAQPFPTLRQVVLDCTDARLLAEFYRQLLGYRYRPGYEPPPTGHPDPQAERWLVLRDARPDSSRSRSNRSRPSPGPPGRRGRSPSSSTST